MSVLKIYVLNVVVAGEQGPVNELYTVIYMVHVK